MLIFVYFLPLSNDLTWAPTSGILFVLLMAACSRGAWMLLCGGGISDEMVWVGVYFGGWWVPCVVAAICCVVFDIYTDLLHCPFSLSLSLSLVYAVLFSCIGFWLLFGYNGWLPLLSLVVVYCGDGDLCCLNVMFFSVFLFACFFFFFEV